VAFLVLVAVMVPTVAHARSSRADAQAALRRGNLAFDRGDYEAALASFRKARVIYPSNKILLNIGITLDLLRRGPEAISCLERFLLLEGRAPRRAIREARARIAALKRRLSCVEVKSGVPDATVTLGTMSIGRTPAARVCLEPGTYTLRVEKKGYATSVQRVLLGTGEHRELNVQIQPLAVRRGDAWRRSRAKDVVGGSRSLAEAAAGQRRTTIWAYTTLGIGLACAVGAGVLYGVGAHQGNSAHEKYAEATSKSGGDISEIVQYREDVESAGAKLLAAHFVVGSAVVALGVSIYLFSNRRALSPGRGRDVLTGSLLVVPTTTGGALAVRGQF